MQGSWDRSALLESLFLVLLPTHIWLICTGSVTLLTSGLCRVSVALGRSKQGRMVSPWAWLFVHKTAAPVATWLRSDSLPGCLMGIGWGAAPEVLRQQDVKCPKPWTGAELLCLGVQGLLPIHPLHIWHQGRDLRRAEIIAAFCQQRSLPANSAFSHFENKRPKKDRNNCRAWNIPREAPTCLPRCLTEGERHATALGTKLSTRPGIPFLVP